MAFLTLTPQEIDLLIDHALAPDEDSSPGEKAAAKRRIFALVIDFVDGGECPPERLATWLVGILLTLHKALDGPSSKNERQNMDVALLALGSATNGRPPQEHDEVAIAAAVTGLARYLGKTRAVEATALGLALSQDEVWRICAGTEVQSGWDGLLCNEESTSHAGGQAYAVAVAWDILPQIQDRLGKSRPDLWPREMADLLRVTPAG